MGVAPGRGLTGVVVGVLGLTFKAGTDDLRDSPSLTMVSSLIASGAKVQAFDPTVETDPQGDKAKLLAGVDLASSVARGRHRGARARHRHRVAGVRQGRPRRVEGG